MLCVCNWMLLCLWLVTFLSNYLPILQSVYSVCWCFYMVWIPDQCEFIVMQAFLA